LTNIPTYEIKGFRNCQGTDAVGQTSAWLLHYSTSTSQYAFPVPSDATGTGASYPANSRLLKVRGTGSQDEWYFLISFIAPPNTDYGAGGYGGSIRNWHCTVGDVGNGGLSNGHKDSNVCPVGDGPHSDNTSCMHLHYDDNNRISTTLAAPYSGGSTMTVANASIFSSLIANSRGFGNLMVGDTIRRDYVHFTGISGATLTGCTTAQPKGKTTGGAAVFPSVTWPVGTTVDGPEGGLRLTFNNYITGGGWAALPNPVAGQRYDIVLHAIFGRNDNLDPSLPVAMRSNRAGRLTVYVNGNDSPVLDLQNACVLQRTDNYYKTPGFTYVQQYVDFWDGGPYIVYAKPHVRSDGVADGRDGPWKYTTAATRMGTTVNAAVADAPIPSGTVNPHTAGNTEPNIFFNADANWGITGGVAHGTQNHNIPGTSPDFGAWTVNMTNTGGTNGTYTVSTPAQMTAEAFQMPPSLGSAPSGTAPSNTAVPTISGTKASGSTLTGTDGTWAGSPTSYTYRWLYAIDGADFQPLSGQTASTLALTSAHVGLAIRYEVTAANTYGGTVAQSVSTVAITGTSNELLQNPDIETDTSTWGKNQNTETLTRDTGTKHAGAASLKVVTPGTVGFEGTNAHSTLGAYCPAGTARTATVWVNAPVAASIRCSLNTFTPGVSGVSVVAAPVTITGNGAFQQATMNAPAPSADSYQRISVTTGSTTQAITFYVDDASLKDTVATPSTPVYVTSTSVKGFGSTISSSYTVAAGSNRALYVVVSYDEKTRPVTSVAFGAQSLTLVKKPTVATAGGNTEIWRLLAPTVGTATVTVTNSSTVQYVVGIINFTNVDQTTPESASAENVSASGTRPTVTVASSQSGTVVGGVAIGYTSALTLAGDSAQTARWNQTQNTTTTYGVVAAGASIAGSASVTLGWTASGTSGQPWAAAATSVKGISGSATTPANTAVPVISGTVTQGQTLSSTDGTWSNTPTAFSYQWNRAGVAITGATQRTYTLTVDDVASTMTVTVTAQNDAGSASATSVATAAVAGLAPELVLAPVAFGPVTVGSTLATTDGTWNNTPTSYTYQMKRETAAGNGTYADVVGQTASSYVTVTADVGYSFEWVVTAVNAYGSASSTSSAIGPVEAAVVPTPPDVPGRTLSLEPLTPDTLTLTDLDDE
jgi:hypothetical protein